MYVELFLAHFLLGICDMDYYTEFRTWFFLCVYNTFLEKQNFVCRCNAFLCLLTPALFVVSGKRIIWKKRETSCLHWIKLFWSRLKFSRDRRCRSISALRKMKLWPLFAFVVSFVQFRKTYNVIAVIIWEKTRPLAGQPPLDSNLRVMPRILNMKWCSSPHFFAVDGPQTPSSA